MRISDEIVESAARAYFIAYHHDSVYAVDEWEDPCTWEREPITESMREALESVAPLIAAQALNEAADAMDEDEIEACPSGKWTIQLGFYGESDWLRGRADQIKRGESGHDA